MEWRKIPTYWYKGRWNWVLKLVDQVVGVEPVGQVVEVEPVD